MKKTKNVKIQFWGVGRRKKAIARVRISSGGENGIIINKKPMDEYFKTDAQKFIVKQPLELTGTAAYYLLNNKVDGIIALSAFGCGPDSLMVDEMMYHCKETGMPLIHLTIDEHTGEAGFVTRLEAFVDMMMRKKRNLLNKQSAKTPKTAAEVVKIRNDKVLTGSAK